MPSDKILIIEDEESIAELIGYNLKKSGYKTFRAESAEEALKLLEKQSFDLILLDLMLPGMDGLDFCRLLRQDATHRATPVIMLTARSEDADVVSGLELGADDYVTKPFSPRVLLARVRARLRQGPLGAEDAEENLSFMGIELNSQFHEAKIDGQPTELTANEFSLLKLFVKNAGRVYSRDDLISYLHGPGYAVTDRAIDVQIAGLRKKLGKKSALIETVRGVGYKFARERQF